MHTYIYTYIYTHLTLKKQCKLKKFSVKWILFTDHVRLTDFDKYML